MATLVGILLIVFMLIASVAIHEAGHLVTAKHYGMKATQYFIGFGPKIFSFRRGETEYGLKAIPAGGYVKIIGMSPLEALEGESAPDPRLAAAEVAALPTKTEPDERRLFYTYPARQRFVVLVAGSSMHFVLAVLLTFAGLAIGGDLTRDPGVSTKVAEVLNCVNANENNVCPPGAAPSPAKLAGLQDGDKIVGVNGVAVNSWDAVTAVLKGSTGKAVRLTVDRDGAARTLTVTPVAKVQTDANGVTATTGFVGLASSYNPYPTYNPLQAAAHTPSVLWSYVTGTVSKLHTYPHSVVQLATGQKRDGTGLVGVVDVSRIGGSIASAPESLATKAGELLFIGASVNFFVGVFNLLPLLPLDGGHIAILGFENVRAWFARRLRRPDPGRVNLLKVLPVAYVVVAVFVGLSALLVYAGFTNPIQGT
jgi:membrane-associated protease RseP (regulator of RpoE activity)